MIPMLLAGIIGMAATGLASNSLVETNSSPSETFGVGGGAAYNALASLKDKEYFSTEEAMILLQLSKPTILRRFKEWHNNHDAKDGLPYEGNGGRGGFRVSRNAIRKYADDHGIALDWGKLVVSHLDKKAEETVRTTGISQKNQTLQKIELDNILLQRAELEVEYLSLELQEEKDPTKIKELRKKILETRMRIKNIEYDIKVLEFSLDRFPEGQSSSAGL